MVQQNRPIIFLFSGQGSQYYQMGKELYETNNTFRHILQGINHDLAGLSPAFQEQTLTQRMYAPNKTVSEPFDALLYSHVAIFVIEYALAQTLIESGVKPDAVLGTSVGEVAALVIAGSLTLQDGLTTVLKQAHHIIQHCQSASMLAILASPDIMTEAPSLFQETTLASLNFDQHFVITGERDRISTIVAHLQQENITHQRLPVNYGFHSHLIDRAATTYLYEIASLPLTTPAIPYYSCASASSLTTFPKHYLWDIIRKPIRFQEMVQQLIAQNDYHFVDVGPGSTLSTFLKYNLSNKTHQCQLYLLLTPFSGDAQRLETCLAALKWEKSLLA